MYEVLKIGQTKPARYTFGLYLSTSHPLAKRSRHLDHLDIVSRLKMIIRVVMCNLHNALCKGT